MKRGNFYPKGVTKVREGFQFVFKTEKPAKDIEIVIFAGEAELRRAKVTDEHRQGQMYSVILEDIPEKADGYCYYADGEELFDAYARGVRGMEAYGKEKGRALYALPGEDYDWEEDIMPGHSYGMSVIYGIHVRGFTKHTSSGVKRKGTFAGVREKLPYLKELGVTALELMPAYEFDEMEKPERNYQAENVAEPKINYWGFKPGYYYAPKSAYASEKDAVSEMKDMVRALHKAGIEVLMQFYFPGREYSAEIPDILRFWVQEYHIDGFHLIGDKLPFTALAADPMLRATKLIGTGLSPDGLYQENQKEWNRNLAIWQESFTYDMRKALKGDEGCLNALVKHLQDNGKEAGVINAISGYGGFTLHDLVSYERKHNEANGEGNQDGSDYNYSWNCGAEGRTRKRAVQTLRKKQMRNALAFVFLSQGTPYLQSGDEFGQTQDGNNNPYCQDNEITWLDWRLLKNSRALYDYTRELIGFRKSHGVFHREQPLNGMDYLGYGAPDISFHGEEAWKPVMEHYRRHIGVMYCGKYADNRNGLHDTDFYAAYNMHWEPHEFALPRLSREMEWQLCMDTAHPQPFGQCGEETERAQPGDTIVVKERSVRMYMAVKKVLKKEE